MAQPAQANVQIVQPQAPAQQQAQQQQQQQQQQQGQQQAPAQVAATNGNGALKGNPPVHFTGDRAKSRGFLNAFNLYKETNRNNETMKNPYSRVTTALTYMTGDMMESWKEDQLQQLIDRVAGGTPDTDEQHWQLFETEFRNAFTNTNAAKDAQRELRNLKQGESLDEYITKFKQLARLGNLPFTEHGVIEQFKLGLKGGLLDAIIRTDHYDPQIAWTLERWIEEAHKQHGKWKELRSYRPDARARLYQAFGVRGNRNNNNHGGRRTTSQGGDAMDVDSIEVNTTNTPRRYGQTHSEEKKQELMKNNQCFYCEIRGHRARDCRKKQAARANQSQGGTSVKTNTVTQMTPTELTKFLQENMGNLDEDAKISVIESLMPSSFVQGSN